MLAYAAPPPHISNPLVGRHKDLISSILAWGRRKIIYDDLDSVLGKQFRIMVFGIASGSCGILSFLSFFFVYARGFFADFSHMSIRLLLFIHSSWLM